MFEIRTQTCIMNTYTMVYFLGTLILLFIVYNTQFLLKWQLILLAHKRYRTEVKLYEKWLSSKCSWPQTFYYGRNIKSETALKKEKPKHLCMWS